MLPIEYPGSRNPCQKVMASDTSKFESERLSVDGMAVGRVTHGSERLPLSRKMESRWRAGRACQNYLERQAGKPRKFFPSPSFTSIHDTSETLPGAHPGPSLDAHHIEGGMIEHQRPLLNLRMREARPGNQPRRHVRVTDTIDVLETMVTQTEVYRCRDYIARRRTRQESNSESSSCRDPPPASGNSTDSGADAEIDAICREKMCEWS